jgi:hypothetical protein
VKFFRYTVSYDTFMLVCITFYLQNALVHDEVTAEVVSEGLSHKAHPPASDNIKQQAIYSTCNGNHNTTQENKVSCKVRALYPSTDTQALA